MFGNQITQAAFDAVKNNPNGKIRAIKQFKESTGWGLIESKTVIDLVMELVKSEKQLFEPDWSKVPDGYNWVAVEERGETFCYKDKPYWNDYNDYWDTDTRNWQGLLTSEVFNFDAKKLIWKRPGQFFENWTEEDYFAHCGKFYANQYDERYMLAQVGDTQFRLISKKGNRFADGSCFGSGVWREVDSW